MAVRNLRDVDSPVWLWDTLNAEIQQATGRNIRTSDVDGAVHMFRRWGEVSSRDPILLIEGTTNPHKPESGQLQLLKALALREQITVLYFVGPLPVPPEWVATFASAWASGELDAGGYWDKARWDRWVRGEL